MKMKNDANINEGAQQQNISVIKNDETDQSTQESRKAAGAEEDASENTLEFL